ncbi:MAG: transcriptional regulator, partial [Pseudomonadales bacterium]|nr:transcriptional regulator [Pseudomonadales bacterium]
MYDYEEVCPVSRAASILCERWTLQIVREMLFGASRFSDLQKYLPKLSPTLLNTRLKTLEQQGIVIRTRIAEKRGYEYR